MSLWGAIKKTVSKTVKSVKKIGKLAVPGPVGIVKNVLDGQRIDKAVLTDFKDRLKAIREVAPYAQAVTSMVPGIGTGVAGAIAASAALAAGKRIDAALIAGVEGSLPVAARVGLKAGLQLAAGKNVLKATLEGVRAGLPEGARRGFDVGIALANGRKIQDIAIQQAAGGAKAFLGTVPKIGSIFKVDIPSSKGLTAAAKIVSAVNGKDMAKAKFAASLVARTASAAKLGDPQAISGLAALTKAKNIMSPPRLTKRGSPPRLDRVHKAVVTTAATSKPITGVLFSKNSQKKVIASRGKFARAKTGQYGVLTIQTNGRTFTIRDRFKKVG